MDNEWTQKAAAELGDRANLYSVAKLAEMMREHHAQLNGVPGR